MIQSECVIMSGLVLACIVSGALTTVSLKCLFETNVSLPDGSITTFSCSFFATLLQFLAMTMLVLLQVIVQNVSSWMSNSQAASKPREFSGWDAVCYLFGRYNVGLSTFQVIVTLCTQAALVFVPATVYAALRQGNIPLIAVIRVYLLEKRCALHQMVGAAIVTFGLALMGITSHAGRNHVHGAMHYVSGICLLCLAAVLLAGRYVTEEFLMQHKKIPPMIVVGAQGVLGSIASTILLVFAHRMGYEDFWMTSRMLHASSQVQLLVVAFVVLTILYNIVMAYTTQIFDATCKAMIRGTKPISIWALQLLCFYFLGPKYHYGEPWTPPGSWCVLFAAIIVSGGLCLYFYEGSKMINKPREEDKLEYGTLVREAGRQLAPELTPEGSVAEKCT